MKKPQSHHSAFLFIAAGLMLASCGGGESTPAAAVPATPEAPAPQQAQENATPAPGGATAATAPYPAGFITASDLTLGPIDQGLVEEGKKIFDAKCHVCHSLTDQKVVGPGWKGVTKERKPEWIMNMILHTQWMLENDTAAQNLVELTKAQMTDQGLTKDQARAMLELMRTL